MWEYVRTKLIYCSFYCNLQVFDIYSAKCVQTLQRTLLYILLSVYKHYRGPCFLHGKADLKMEKYVSVQCWYRQHYVLTKKTCNMTISKFIYFSSILNLLWLLCRSWQRVWNGHIHILQRLQIRWMRNNELIVSGDDYVIFYQEDVLECGLFCRYWNNCTGTPARLWERSH